MNIEGLWTGEITYGKGYYKHEHAVLFFEMDITQEGDTIRGTSIDLEGFGVSPDPAEFFGKIENEEISFIKQYPFCHYTDREGNIGIDKSKKGPEIHYNGSYNEINGSWSGEWKLTMKWYLFGFIPYKNSGHGRWSLKRKHVSQG